MCNYFLIIGTVKKILEDSLMVEQDNQIHRVYLEKSTLDMILDKLSENMMIGVRGNFSDEEEHFKLKAQKIVFFGKED